MLIAAQILQRLRNYIGLENEIARRQIRGSYVWKEQRDAVSLAHRDADLGVEDFPKYRCLSGAAIQNFRLFLR
jgi:hypothetical protein